MSFKEVLRQDVAIALLKAAYQKNRLAHAYLCVGPDGIGKKETVLNFIKLLFCEEKKDGCACGVCSNCLKVGSYNHADIHWLEPDGQFIKVDDVREACRRLSLRGFESFKKVLVICQAQCLNEESSNALLKTLEEPNPNTVIFLLTDSIKSVLPTIASRCQRIIFSLLPEIVLIKFLIEHFHLKPQDALYCARIAQGSPGEALKCYRSGLLSRKNEIIKNVLSRGRALDKCIDFRSASTVDKQDAIDELLRVLSSWFRDILLAKASVSADYFINVDASDEILSSSRSFSMDDIIKRLSSIAEAFAQKSQNINERVSLAKLRVDLWI